ncbi:MAG: tetratricopeptide repeat protein [Candidatus Zipacnadales bacterium]
MKIFSVGCVENNVDRRSSRCAQIVNSLLVSVLLTGAAWSGPLDQAKRLLRSGEAAQAQAMLQGFVAQRPDDREALFWLGRAALEAGNQPLARESFQTLLEAQPRSAKEHYWLGVCLERGGDLAGALREYRATLAIEREHPGAVEGVGRLTPLRSLTDRFRHHAVALEVEGDLQVNRAQTEVRSPHIYDYTFTEAPADWIMEVGDWRVRSRWSCTPTWNFMGGESPQVAALWNKREFLGDLTVEAYLSYKMNVLGEGGYRNGTDFNLSICADGRNLSSGYSFIVGGWGNSWTRILKGTQVLAETNAPRHKPVTLLDGQPGSWAWHRRWWEIRAVKRGEYLYLFFDNELVLQAHDPDPLPGGRIAFWTFDNGIIIPRVKIYYEHEVPAEQRSNPPYAPFVRMEDQPPVQPLVTFTSETHPSIQATFDHDLGGWTRRDGQHGARLSLDSLTADGNGRCLLLTNEFSGGTFGATAVPGPFDVVRMNRLCFDYRISPEVKVNLQLTAAGKRFEIIFTAPEFPSDRALRLAQIPAVQSDRQWHHVDLDLLACLRRFLPVAESIEVTDLWFGLDTTRNYCLAGFGANPALCEYRLDNFAIYGAGPPEGELRLAQAPPAGGAAQPAVGFDYIMGESPEEKPDSCYAHTTDGMIQWADLPTGVHYINARAVYEDGTLGPLYSYRIVVDQSPPAVAFIEPSPATPIDGEELRLTLVDDGTGVNPASLVLRLNDVSLTVGAPGISYDPVEQTATIRPGEAGMVFGKETEVSLVLEKVADWRGNALKEPMAWHFTYDRNLDKEPPGPPKVILPREPLCQDTFEGDLGHWQPYPASIMASLTLDESTAASGRCSLRVYNPASGGAMGAVPYPEPFDAGVYRIVSFDYKLRPEVRIDLYVVVNGTAYTVRFSDNDGPNPIGTFEGVQLDDRWHHAECNLYELLRAASPTAPGYIVTTLAFLDAGNYGNIQHQFYNIDNFALVPVLSLRQGSVLGVNFADPAGVVGLSYLVDAQSDTEPPTVSATGSKLVTLPALPGVESWLHTKVVDGARNWSPTTHQRLLVDAQPPRAAVVSPADNAVTATSRIILDLTDEGIAGIDPQSIQLEVADKTYTVEDAGLVYNSANGRLVWNCEHTSGGPVVFANGQSVPVRLLAAADYAGNALLDLPMWKWRMDYTQDRQPPVLASLTSGTHSTLLAHRFEGDTHEIQPYGQGSSAKVELETASPDGTGQSVKITNSTGGGNLAFYLLRSNIATGSYPFISFDYRIPPGVSLDLLVYFYNEALWFQLTGNAGGYYATVPGIIADGQWHHCIYNLHEAIAQRAAQREIGAYYTTSYLAVMHRNSDAALPAGVAVNIDNLVVGAIGPKAATLSWSATDTTGIAGYSYIMDQSANTEPSPIVQDTNVQAQFADLPLGVNWFHIRALDGAGNWGPTSHYAILVQ